jgi:hypothetical protein
MISTVHSAKMLDANPCPQPRISKIEDGANAPTVHGLKPEGLHGKILPITCG